MTYERFEDLPVWHKAADLYEATEDLLENSDIKGQRHLSNKTRAEDDKKKRAAALNKELIRRLPAWHPKRKEAENGLI